jgi:ferredoxin
MKASIRYFSGTGNSWRIASVCTDTFRSSGYETDLESIRRGWPPLPATDAACFCFPVYSLDLPRIASAYLRRLPPSERQVPAFLLVTGGDPDNCGWAIESGVRLLAERGYPVRIAELIQMPDNWTPFHSAPEPVAAERMTGRGVETARKLTERFLTGEMCVKPVSLRKFGRLGSMLLRVLFHRRGVFKLWQLFRVTGTCNGCGLCERACPTGSIRMQAGRPVWSITCEQCMRCLNYCPSRSITQLDFLLHGSSHRAYHYPGFTHRKDELPGLGENRS